MDVVTAYVSIQSRKLSNGEVYTKTDKKSKLVTTMQTYRYFITNTENIV